jgi:hypothetical protein
MIEDAAPARIGTDELDSLLSTATVVREADTGVSGMIRILVLDQEVLVQEQTPAGKILLRRRADLAAATAFVDRRLQLYERMWDGCGCKVDYAEP